MVCFGPLNEAGLGTAFKVWLSLGKGHLLLKGGNKAI